MDKCVMPLAFGLAVGWASIGLGLLLYRVGTTWWRRRRFGSPIDHGALVVEYGRKMTGVLDQRSLAQLLTAEIPRLFQVKSAALLLPEDHQLVVASQDKPNVSAEMHLSISHAAVRWVAASGEAQRADHGRLYDLVGQGSLAWAQVWVPLMRGTELHGMWLLGTRDDNILYSPADLHWLTTVGRQAASVLETTRHAEEERRAASEIRALYRQVVSAREMERARIARELHDGVLQDLCAVTRDLRALETQVTANGALYADLAAHSGESVNALRAICNDLRPPLLQHDLASALRALVEELDARSSAPIHIEVTAKDLDLSDDVAVAVFRIMQEALHNAIQHADASEIAVFLTRYPDRLRLTVTDDGRGIADGVEPARFVAQGHFGLAGMRERAAMIGGKLNVQTAVDYGTVVILELPLAQSNHRESSHSR